MCKFCEKIYDFNGYVDDSIDYISQDDIDGKFWLHANNGNKYAQSLLFDIKYCPYCGMELKNEWTSKPS